jgi:carboxypeptidase Taq
MKADLEKKLNGFKEYVKDLEYLSNAFAALYWDTRVNAPKKGVPYRSGMLGYLSAEQYKLQTSPAVKDFLDEFSAVPGLDDVTAGMVRVIRREYDRTMKIPEKEYREYAVATSEAEAVWEEARAKSDFALFRPHLKKLIDYNRRFIGYWGYKGTPYDTLLDFYEPGATVETVNGAFVPLRDAIVSLLERIGKSRVRPDDTFFKKVFPAAQQEAFGRHVLEKTGYDFEAGRLDVSTHPFTITLGPGDIRITTRYLEHEFRSALFGSIHEGGHAMYEQDIPSSLVGTSLFRGVSMGIHESQSRFWENIIGRSRAFWTHFLPEAKKRFPQFEGVSLEAFYRGINTVTPSFIRVEADELTYSLHVIIRYEIEQQIFNGGAEADDLPALWNRKYQEYLNIEPKNDAEGILQDMHWSGGSFGYFPSYALGNLYSGQFLHAMKKDLPDLNERVAAGDFTGICDWLKNKIHVHGSIYDPGVLLKMVTGEELSAQYFIDYLNEKYGELYEL